MSIWQFLERHSECFKDIQGSFKECSKDSIMQSFDWKSEVFIRWGSVGDRDNGDEQQAVHEDVQLYVEFVHLVRNASFSLVQRKLTLSMFFLIQAKI